MFCRTRSLSNATFSFGRSARWHSSSSKSAAIYKISQKSDDFSEVWRYNNFQNGGHLLSWILEIFIFDHVMFIQFKICCCVQNFIKIGWFFTEIWRYIDFQNGGHALSWNYFTTVRDHPRSLCYWPQLPVKSHVNPNNRSEDIAIWIFCIFGLKCLFMPPRWRFWGTLLWTPKCDYSSSRLRKGTSLHTSTSFKLSTVKIRWGVWPVGELTESVTDTDTHR